MCIKNRPLSLIYKILVLCLCGFGLYSYSGLPEGTLDLSAFQYFTILSNLLVFLFMLAAAIYVVRRIAKSGARGYATYAPGMKGAVLMSITVTMLIYWFILAPNAFIMEGGDTTSSLRNNIVHLYVPVAVLVDWLLFDRKGRWPAYAPFAWEIIPLLYWGYTIVAARLGVTFMNGASYPYDFINVDKYGWPAVLRTVGILCLAFLVLGYLIWGLDRLLALFDKSRGRIVYSRGQSLAVPSGVTQRPNALARKADADFSQPLDSEEDPEKERLVERALEAEPALGDELAGPIAEEFSLDTGVAEPVQPSVPGDAAGQVSATAGHGGAEAPSGQAAQVTTATPGDDGPQ